MQIICLACGHKIDLRDAYDDYAGLVRDSTCGALLEIRTEVGTLRSVAQVVETAMPSSGRSSETHSR